MKPAPVHKRSGIRETAVNAVQAVIGVFFVSGFGDHLLVSSAPPNEGFR